jgi:hypothetical protein
VAKRPKLEPHASTSSGTTSSGASQHGSNTPTGRMRVESSASTTSQWPLTDGHPSPQNTAMPKLILAHGGSNSLGSPPNTNSPAFLPGYRDSIFAGNNQVLSWREGQRDDVGASVQQLPRISSIGDRRPSRTGPASDALNLTGSLQHAHRTGQSQSHPPPLLTSESTNRSSTSSASTNSSAFFTPRTPMEPALDRALPIPSMYPQKSSGSYESQLPPLRPPSLSPQSSSLGSQLSPNGILISFHSCHSCFAYFTTSSHVFQCH